MEDTCGYTWTLSHQAWWWIRQRKDCWDQREYHLVSWGICTDETQISLPPYPTHVLIFCKQGEALEHKKSDSTSPLKHKLQ
jgi:hypothetical protein